MIPVDLEDSGDEADVLVLKRTFFSVLLNLGRARCVLMHKLSQINLGGGGRGGQGGGGRGGQGGD